MRSFSLALIAATVQVNALNQYVRFPSSNMNWAQAAAKCSSMKMRLAHINSKSQQAAAFKASGGKGGWIGLTDQAKEGTWRWGKNGPRAGYTNWYKNEPNNSGNEDCVQMYSNGQWNDNKCHNNAGGAICQRSAAQMRAHHRAVANRRHYVRHNNMFNRNIRSSKTWYSYIRSNTAHFRHTTAMRAHRNKMVAKYFAARNHAGRWASIRNHRWSVARKNRAMMNKTRKTANWWSRHTANMNKNRIAKSRHWSAMRNQQRKYARWGVNQVRHAQRQRSAWNRKWAGIVARAAKANRAALAAYHKANAQKSKAWKGYHASNANYLRHLKSYRSAVGTLRHAHSRKAYWLKLARVSHHKLVSYVRSGAGRGYFH